MASILSRPQCVNTLWAELHFLWFLNTDMAQVAEIFPQGSFRLCVQSKRNNVTMLRCLSLAGRMFTQNDPCFLIVIEEKDLLLSYTVNDMAVDGMAMQGARTSAGMALT